MNLKVTSINPFGLVIEPLIQHQSIHAFDVQKFKEYFRKYHLLLFRGFAPFESTKEFEGYCETWGEISIWPFGKVLELVEHENPDDHIFDNNYVPMHWDGMYRPQVPEYQIFRCVHSPGKNNGGRTTFSNTVLALKNAEAQWVDLWRKATGIYKRKMQFYDSITVSPIITKHPYREEWVIRYNEPPSKDKGNFLNPPILEFRGIDPKEQEFLHSSLGSALYDERHFYAHAWQEGDLVVADNFSLLHGREGFPKKSPRHLQRVHVLSDPPFSNPGLESYK